MLSWKLSRIVIEPELIRLLRMSNGSRDVVIFLMTFTVVAIAVAGGRLVKPIEPRDTGHQETQQCKIRCRV